MDDRERQIRAMYDRSNDPDCNCDWCYILDLLDAERAQPAALNLDHVRDAVGEDLDPYGRSADA